MRSTFDDRDFDIVASNPVLNSHGEMLYPMAVSHIESEASPVQTQNPETPEGSWKQWVRVDPTVGDPVQGPPQTGAQDRLGYRTGMTARSARSYGFTGRMLTAPRVLVHPAVGEVGRDNAADRLTAQVRAQETDFTPSASEIARNFLAMRGVRGAQSTINDAL